MIEKIKKIVIDSFEEDFEIKEVDKKFSDYDGWDSLTAMVLIDRLEEKFEIELEVDQINEMSVSSIQEILMK